MHNYLKNTPLKTLILGFILILIAISVLTVTCIFFAFTNKGVVIDVAGRNRMLSQRMVLFAGIYIQENDQEAKKVCQAAKNLHDTSVLAMKNGGEAPDMLGKYLKPAHGEALDYLKRVEELWDIYRKNVDVILKEPLYLKKSAKEADSVQFTQAYLNPRVLSSHQFLRDNATQILIANNELVKAYVRQSSSSENLVQTFLVLCILTSILMLFVSYYTFKKFLFSPIRQIVSKAEKVSRGDYTESLDDLGKNELGQLVKALNTLFNKFRESANLVKEMGKGNLDYSLQISSEAASSDTFVNALRETQQKLKQAQAEQKHRNWMNEGFALFGDLLRREEDSLKALARLVVAELVKYLDANQGGLFVVTESEKDPHLDMLACYAYDRQKFLKKRIAFGEGIIGEIFLEGETKYMTDIPDDYLQITSGLGGETPGYLIVVPLKTNESTYGVLEIASFKPITSYHLEFVEKVGESIATTIANRRKNEETLSLYQQAQIMTEELRVKEEEMRQNMEELQATQEEMRRKEREYLRIIDKLQEEKQSPSSPHPNQITWMN